MATATAKLIKAIQFHLFVTHVVQMRSKISQLQIKTVI